MSEYLQSDSNAIHIRQAKRIVLAHLINSKPAKRELILSRFDQIQFLSTDLFDETFNLIRKDEYKSLPISYLKSFLKEKLTLNHKEAFLKDYNTLLDEFLTFIPKKLYEKQLMIALESFTKNFERVDVCKIIFANLVQNPAQTVAQINASISPLSLHSVLPSVLILRWALESVITDGQVRKTFIIAKAYEYFDENLLSNHLYDLIWASNHENLVEADLQYSISLLKKRYIS